MNITRNIQKHNNKRTDEQLIALTDIIKLMKIRVDKHDKHDEELSLIIQDERMDVL